MKNKTIFCVFVWRKQIVAFIFTSTKKMCHSVSYTYCCYSSQVAVGVSMDNSPRKNIEILFSFYIKLNDFFSIVETFIICTYIFERMEPQFLAQ